MFGAHRGPKLELTEAQSHNYGDWVAIRNAATDWLMVTAPELAQAVEVVISRSDEVDPGVIISEFSPDDALHDMAMGGRLHATANAYMKQKLITDTTRYSPNWPSAVKIYHHLPCRLRARTGGRGGYL